MAGSNNSYLGILMKPQVAVTLAPASGLNRSQVCLNYSESEAVHLDWLDLCKSFRLSLTLYFLGS